MLMQTFTLKFKFNHFVYCEPKDDLNKGEIYSILVIYMVMLVILPLLMFYNNYEPLALMSRKLQGCSLANNFSSIWHPQ